MRRVRLFRLLAVVVLGLVWLATTVAIRTLLPPAPRATLPAAAGSPHAYFLSFSPDGRTVATANVLASAVQFWDVDCGKHQLSVPFERSDEVIPVDGRQTRDPGLRRLDRVVFSPDSRLAALRTKDALAFWDIASGRQVGQIEARVAYPEFSSDSRVLAGKVYPLKQLKLWEVPSGRELTNLPTLPTVEDWYSWPRFILSPNGEAVAIQGEQKDRVGLWSNANPQELTILTGQYRDLAFSRDGSLLALCDGDTIRLYDTRTGRERTTFTSAEKWVGPVAFSPDGRHVASVHTGLGKTTVRLWDRESGEESTVLDPECHSGIVGGSLRFSEDGQLLLFGCPRHWPMAEEETLWDVHAQPPRMLCRLPFVVSRELVLDRRLAIVPDYGHAPVNGFRKTARAWLSEQWSITKADEGPMLQVVNLSTGTVVAPVTHGKHGKWHLSTDGRTLFVRSQEGTVGLWDVPPREQTATAASLGLIPVGFLGVAWWWYRRRIGRRAAVAISAC